MHNFNSIEATRFTVTTFTQPIQPISAPAPRSKVQFFAGGRPITPLSQARKDLEKIESEKINRKIPNVEIPWKNIDILITDADLPDELKAKLLEQDVKLLIAK